ncbi:hypothetical protein GE061_015711 [Apolygus lucorum]|uniref:Uncharacterized protein n=1 Tax=Apolygus lucorum TaxID=248454 RepID=A0A8S9XPK4_APOLU|nr:hypothetical protein GE061_015711 [Apolygus lucorum]
MVWDSGKVESSSRRCVTEACCALVMHNIDRYEEYYLNVNSQKDLLAVRNFQSFLDIFGVERPPTGPPPVIDLTTTTTTDLPHTTVIVSPIIDLRTPISSPSEHQQTSSPNIIDLRTPISSPSEQQQQQTSSPLVFSEDEEVPPTPQTSPIPMIYDYSSDEREERVERRRKLFERFK